MRLCLRDTSPRCPWLRTGGNGARRITGRKCCRKANNHSYSPSWAGSSGAIDLGLRATTSHGDTYVLSWPSILLTDGPGGVYADAVLVSGAVCLHPRNANGGKVLTSGNSKCRFRCSPQSRLHPFAIFDRPDITNPSTLGDLPLDPRALITDDLILVEFRVRRHGVAKSQRTYCEVVRLVRIKRAV